MKHAEQGARQWPGHFSKGGLCCFFSLSRISIYYHSVPPLLLHFILPIYYEMPRRELALLELVVIIIYIMIRREILQRRGEGRAYFSGCGRSLNFKILYLTIRQNRAVKGTEQGYEGSRRVDGSLSRVCGRLSS